jgi:hypothetical protein
MLVVEGCIISLDSLIAQIVKARHATESTMPNEKFAERESPKAADARRQEDMRDNRLLTVYHIAIATAASKNPFAKL